MLGVRLGMECTSHGSNSTCFRFFFKSADEHASRGVLLIGQAFRPLQCRLVLVLDVMKAEGMRG